ncbi:uncharacterized protein zpy1.L isoform X2 [Xenopus laevis]|uniref:Uncharacterized protein zpy1.L isoform X2 n=2 Tax=Xenopus laevis TaxID=8355 RepID=A0A1L8H3P3_XENLA|nr:uncharacterized protein zpy1.L isoform X2 [Xenopus laevis]OCT90720.1 hypothetical protein XELAEV_18019337mg [Xenopus laevis]
MAFTLPLRFVWLCFLLPPCIVLSANFPSGVSKAECLNRVFWIWVDKDFIGSREWHLEAFNETGPPVLLDDELASQCGYSITNDIYGNLEIRISFLACWVLNVNDLQFDLKVQVLVRQGGGFIPYPVSLSCRITDPWNVREVLCEENFMEVSVRRIVPWIVDWMTEDLQAVWPVTEGGITQRWQVEFQMSDLRIITMSAIEAQRMGYGLNATATRVVFRAPYNTSESQILKVGSYRLEVILAKMYYSQPLIRLIVDTTTACPSDAPIITKTSIFWLTPAILNPLVLDLSAYKDRGLSMGVDGRLLDSSVIAANGYTLGRNTTTVNVTVPIGAPGGYTESDVVNNTYGTTYHIHLMLVHHWRGTTADTTRHSVIKPINTPFKPLLPIFINRTVPENHYFNVSLGNFFPDVGLKAFIIRRVMVTLDEANRRGFRVQTVDNGNGTRAYVLQVPFSDPLVEQMYLDGNKRMYILYVTYILTLLNKKKDFTYTDVVECVLQDVVPPTYDKICEKDRLILNMTRGNIDMYWIPHIRNLPLTAALATSQNYKITQRGPMLLIEIPLFSVGLAYEDISLRGIRARVDFSLKDNKTLQVRSSYSFVCNFPTDQLLLCLPNGTMKATVFSLDTKPRFDPRETHLKDPTCKPQEADNDRALFSFSVFSCGTTRQFVGDYLVYENEVTFDRKGLPPIKPIISRNSTYRLTLRCRYPLMDTQRVMGKYNNSVIGRRGFSTDPISEQAKVIRKRDENTQASNLNVAKDKAFSSFYHPGDFPILIQREETLYFEVDDRRITSPAHKVRLQECWATPSQRTDGFPQWDLIVDGCAQKGNNYSVDFIQGSHSRFQLKIEGDLSEQLYIYCQGLICDSLLEAEQCRSVCNEAKPGVWRRTAPVVEPYELLSAGPIQIGTGEAEVQFRHVEEKSWNMWMWLLSVGLAFISAFTVGSVILAVRLFVC